MKALPASLVLAGALNGTVATYSYAEYDQPEAMNCDVGYETLMSEVEPLPMIGTSDDGWRVYKSPLGIQTFSVAPPELDASPFIARRTAYLADGAWHSVTHACGYGDKTAGDELMRRYKEMDDLVMQELMGAKQAPREVGK